MKFNLNLIKFKRNPNLSWCKTTPPSDLKSQHFPTNHKLDNLLYSYCSPEIQKLLTLHWAREPGIQEREARYYFYLRR